MIDNEREKRKGSSEDISSLEKENRSLFYPSVSLSFIPTDAIGYLKNNKYINYLKLRLSSGSSAGFPRPYQTRSELTINSNIFNDGTQSLQSISSSFHYLGVHSETDVKRLR